MSSLLWLRMGYAGWLSELRSSEFALVDTRGLGDFQGGTTVRRQCAVRVAISVVWRPSPVYSPCRRSSASSFELVYRTIEG